MFIYFDSVFLFICFFLIDDFDCSDIDVVNIEDDSEKNSDEDDDSNDDDDDGDDG